MSHINNDYIIRLFDQILHNSTISPFDYDFASKLRHHFAFAETAVIRSMVVEVTSINLDVLVSLVVKSKILKISLVSLFVYGDIHGFGIARSAEPNLNPKAATAKFKLCQISKTRKNHFKKNTSEV